MSFGWADYVVCGIMLLISSAIGVYYRFSGDKQRTNKVNFFLKDRIDNGMGFKTGGLLNSVGWR